MGTDSQRSANLGKWRAESCWTGDTGMHGHSSHHVCLPSRPCRLRAPTPKTGHGFHAFRACGHHFAFVHVGSLDC